MSPLFRCFAYGVALGLCAYSLQGSAASPLGSFNAAVAEAYADYRVALFQSNNRERERSQASLQRFRSQWQAIVDRYAAAPPDVYAGDPEWRTTLQKVAGIADTALGEIRQGRIEDAHVTLEAIRDELGGLRARNGVCAFSDTVNAYHGVMEEVLTRKLTAEAIDGTMRDSLREELGILRYLAGEMRIRATARERGKPEFQPRLQALFESLERLKQALDGDRGDALLKAIKGLKPPYAKLFLEFG